MIKVRKVLVALTSREERESLQRILSGVHWSMSFAQTFPQAEASLRNSLFGVVICTARFEDGRCWQDVLAAARRKPIAPRVIVADRLADETLWAEVLNLGCHDLLMTPFATEEVLRVVPMAWNFWERDMTRQAGQEKPQKSWLQSPRNPQAIFGD